MAPIHEHDCDRCVFLGTAVVEDGFFTQYDWYVCPQGGWPTFVRRRSSDPPDYGSSDSYLPDIYQDLGSDAGDKAYYLARHWRKHYDRRERMKIGRTLRRQRSRKSKRFDRDFGDLFDI